jgi:hypothetical protein
MKPFRKRSRVEAAAPAVAPSTRRGPFLGRDLGDQADAEAAADRLGELDLAPRRRPARLARPLQPALERDGKRDTGLDAVEDPVALLERPGVAQRFRGGAGVGRGGKASTLSNAA